MMLLIDTSTERGLVGISDGQSVLWDKQLPVGFQTAQHLLPSIQEGFHSLSIEPKDLTCIGIGNGPGSYTGIRVGVMVAQGMAYALQIPMVSVSSLELFVPKESSQSYAAVIDAKIGGLYFKLPGHAPALCNLEDSGRQLATCNTLVTPKAEPLQSKLTELFPLNHWVWEENSPDIQQFATLVYQRVKDGNTKKSIDILYLRKTQAEIEIEKK